MFTSRLLDLDPTGIPTLVAKGACEIVCTVYQNNSAGSGPQIVVFGAAGDVPGALGAVPGNPVSTTSGNTSQSLTFHLKNNDELWAWKGSAVNATVCILETR